MLRSDWTPFDPAQTKTCAVYRAQSIPQSVPAARAIHGFQGAESALVEAEPGSFPDRIARLHSPGLVPSFSRRRGGIDPAELGLFVTGDRHFENT